MVDISFLDVYNSIVKIKSCPKTASANSVNTFSVLAEEDGLV